jgi:hypothetical protein
VSSDNKEASEDGYIHQLYQTTLEIPETNELMLKQMKEYVHKKYSDIQDNIEMIKEKKKATEKIPLKGKRIKTSIVSENSNRIHQLIPCSLSANLVQQPPSDPASPSPLFYRPSWTSLDREPSSNSMRNIFTDRKLNLHPTIKGYSDEVLVDSSCGGVEMVFKTQVRQSLPESNERVRGSRRKDNLIKVMPHNSWHYSSLNNYNNPSRPNSIIKQEIITRVRNEMKIRDPSAKYKNFSSWKEKVRSRIQDKIIIEVYQRNLSEENSRIKIFEKKGMLETLLEETDFVTRKQENKILYGDVHDEDSFSQKVGQRYLATSSENPSSQISCRNETKLEREKYLPEMLEYIRNCKSKTQFPIGGRL